MPARHDRATDPAIVAELALVRLGTATFRRALAGLTDDDFDGPSLLPGWTRGHLLAHVGYNARALSRLVVWADTGVEHPMYASARARAEEIELGATLRPRALRSLCEHSAIELDVRWRDLADDRWSNTVVTAQGRQVPASETLWMRNREVWLHAVDLDAGARIQDIPDTVLRRLLDDITGLWTRRGAPTEIRIRAADGQTWGSAERSAVEVTGTPADLVAWGTGRGDRALRWSKGAPRTAPRWL